jgi:hypothetical protein
MGVPPQAPAKHNWLLGAVIVGAVLYGFYYIGTHDQNQPNPGQTPTPQTQPGTPGQQPGGNPGEQPGGYQQQQPGGQGNQNQAIIQAQQFTGSYNAVNGYVQISQGQWHNGANVALAAAELQCTQLSAAGQALTQNQTTLTGPAQPGQTVTFQPFQIGSVAQGAQKLNCQIVAVSAANN